MKLLIQRVKEASVTIDGELHSSINKGLLIFVGIQSDDTTEDVKWLVNKSLKMRIFDDSEGIMNCSVMDVDGEVLVVSQFTLQASTKKGNRPSYIKAAPASVSEPMYELFVKTVEEELEKTVGRGKFGADMKVALINDGPVTIIMDSKNKE
ncbi:MAG: D-aminoacyl-tRNA deacylase [Rikenellaceae bacterium]